MDLNENYDRRILDTHSELIGAWDSKVTVICWGQVACFCHLSAIVSVLNCVWIHNFVFLCQNPFVPSFSLSGPSSSQFTCTHTFLLFHLSFFTFSLLSPLLVKLSVVVTFHFHVKDTQLLIECYCCRWLNDWYTFLKSGFWILLTSFEPTVLMVALMLQCCVHLSVVCNVCIVAKDWLHQPWLNHRLTKLGYFYFLTKG